MRTWAHQKRMALKVQRTLKKEIKEATDQAELQLTKILKEAAEATTPDKEHLRAMLESHDDLLQIIKKQQANIGEMVKQNGLLAKSLAHLQGTKNPAAA